VNWKAVLLTAQADIGENQIIYWCLEL